MSRVSDRSSNHKYRKIPHSESRDLESPSKSIDIVKPVSDSDASILIKSKSKKHGKNESKSKNKDFHNSLSNSLTSESTKKIIQSNGFGGDSDDVTDNQRLDTLVDTRLSDDETLNAASSLCLSDHEGSVSTKPRRRSTSQHKVRSQRSAKTGSNRLGRKSSRSSVSGEPDKEEELESSESSIRDINTAIRSRLSSVNNDETITIYDDETTAVSAPCNEGRSPAHILALQSADTHPARQNANDSPLTDQEAVATTDTLTDMNVDTVCVSTDKHDHDGAQNSLQNTRLCPDSPNETIRNLENDIDKELQSTEADLADIDEDLSPFMSPPSSSRSKSSSKSARASPPPSPKHVSSKAKKVKVSNNKSRSKPSKPSASKDKKTHRKNKSSNDDDNDLSDSSDAVVKPQVYSGRKTNNSLSSLAFSLSPATTVVPEPTEPSPVKIQQKKVKTTHM